MRRLSAVTVVVGDEPYADCIASVRDFDEIHVFATEASVVEAIKSAGLSANEIEWPACIEDIAPTLLSCAKTDWALFIDPDERFSCASMDALYCQLDNAMDLGLSGFFLPYELSFMGEPLRNTYSGLMKPKLVRPGKVVWSKEIHSVPVPVFDGRFGYLSDHVALITSDLMHNVERRLDRHIKWAKIESIRQTSAVDIDYVCSSLVTTINEYFVRRKCMNDGPAGMLNGLLHLQKTISILLFRAENAGLSTQNHDLEERLRSTISESIRAVDIAIENSR